MKNNKEKKSDKGTTLEVQNILDKDFVNFNIDFERYVLVYSRNYEAIFGEKINETDNSNVLEGFVKLTYNNRSIYRKAIGRKVDSTHIQMGYRTQSELSVNEGENVKVSPTCWFCYYWYNSENYIKHGFRIGLLGFVLAVVSFLIGIIK